MPIIKIYPSKRPVRGILQYITRSDTVPEELIRTNGCDILDAEQEFSDIARYYNKPTGAGNRTYYHMIVSYNTTYEKISPEEVRDMVRTYVSAQKLTVINGILRYILTAQITCMRMLSSITSATAAIVNSMLRLGKAFNQRVNYAMN